MAETDPQTATADNAIQANGADKAAEASHSDKNSDDKPNEISEQKDQHGSGERQHENDDYERYDTDKTKDRKEERQSDRNKRHEYDERGRGGRRNDRGRGGFRGRGRGGWNGGADRRPRGGYHNKRNVRTDFERKEESSDATEIRRQVEYYFSDSNLPIDKFLLEETGGSENKPFPLKTIHQFKRMRHFQPFSTVVEAVKGSDFLIVNENDEVYRKAPLDSKFTLDVYKNRDLLTTQTMRLSIYAKGFGEEKNSTAFDIEELFRPYGARSVRLRREADGTFKGSVFIEFEDEDAVTQFLDMDEKPKFKDNELLVMSKQDYVDKKSNEILEGKIIPKSPPRNQSYSQNNRGGRGRGGHRGNRNGDFKRKREAEKDDDLEKDNWRERRERFQQNREREPTRSRSHSRDPSHAPNDEKTAKAGDGEAKIVDAVTEKATGSTKDDSTVGVDGGVKQDNADEETTTSDIKADT